MKRPIILLCILLLMVVQAGHSMSSANYRIDWHNLLSGSGGPAASAGYKVNFTVGQTVSGTSSSPLYRVQMGYWATAPSFAVRLPIIKKSP
jgi:hypothetical protein